MPKTTTFYIKCSVEETAAIRAAAKKEQRTIHNWLRMATLGKSEGTYPLKSPGLCVPYENLSVAHFTVGEQDYLTIPVERIGPNPSIWQAKPETGIKIITTSTKEAGR
jgi:hypothetical protein